MEKLRLRIEDLRIDRFQTTPCRGRRGRSVRRSLADLNTFAG